MVDQEEARLENSEAILRNLVSEFKAHGIKIKVVDDDTIAYKGVRFDLLDSPTDTLNGVIYLESPSRQVIPIREENLVEGVKSIMQYVESQTENPIGKRKKLWLNGARKGVRKHTMLSKNESVPSFGQMMKSVKDGSFVSKAYLPYDYLPISDGTEQFHVNRKLNGESYHTQHFNTYHTYRLYCEALIERGWEMGREYLDYNDAGGISGATVTFYKETD